MRSLQVRVRLVRPDAPPKRWFSARLRFAVLTDRDGLERYVDSVVLIQATSRDDAFAKALTRGHDREQAYLSHDGLRVRWGFAAVASLDEIPDEDWNGLELAAIPMDPAPQDREAFSFDHTFQPELSRPAETRV